MDHDSGHRTQTCILARRQYPAWLRAQERGRLEQEFLPAERVAEVVREWWGGGASPGE